MLVVASLLLVGDPRIVLPPGTPEAAPSELRYRGRSYALEHDARVAPPELDDVRPAPRTAHAREVGTPTTLFVNFDGITLSRCNPSNAKRNCHWYNFDVEFAPFSGSMQTRVSVLQAMRRAVSELGIRVTGVRPSDDEPYTMVIYGGTEEEFGVLGSAPAGDCYDQLPDEIGFAHIDGELVDWVSGGATTALHEAGHTWGLDHGDVDTDIMYPEGNNVPVGFRRECDGIIYGSDTAPSCPTVNEEICGAPDRQNGRATLAALFGPPYVDATAPAITLVEPRDGQYFQAPATFDVVLDIADDLHPQVYDLRAWLDDDPRPASGTPAVEPGFAIRDLPVGSYEIHVSITDEAGNESVLDFQIEVGVDPPPLEEDGAGEGCACRARARAGVSGPTALVWLLLPALARRRVRR